jgi:hypothetical protein
MRRIRSERASDNAGQLAAERMAKRRRHTPPLLGLQAIAGNEVVNRLLMEGSIPAVQRNGSPKLKKPHPPAGPSPKEVAEREQEEALAAAFRSSTFYYGTTGGATFLQKGATKALPERLKRARERIRERQPGADQGEPATSTVYWPGERFKNFHGQRGEGAEAAQMMDMYYGQAGTSMHEMRNPAIGKHVHEKMGYKGAYHQAKPGREAYMETYSTGALAGVEGWDSKARLFGGGTLTGTMEISRHIRDGIEKYGGTLVFEGKYVTNEGNFVPGAYQGDTNKEAIALFPLFAAQPGASRVPFGEGTLVFNWGGAEQSPEQALFIQNWLYARAFHYGQLGGVPGASLFWKFPGPYKYEKIQEKILAWDRVKAQRVMDHDKWIKRTRVFRTKRSPKLQEIDRALEEFQLVRGAIEKGAPVSREDAKRLAPNEAEAKKFVECTEKLRMAIYVWQAVEGAAASKQATVVAELGRQVRSCEEQWELFRAVKLA